MANSDQREFLRELAQFAAEQRLLIENECEAFPTDPAASAERVLNTQSSFRFFIQTYFPHYITSEPSAFHEYAFGRVQTVLDNRKGDQDAIAAPRGEAKSTLVTQLSVLWVIVTERKRFPVIIMDAFDQSAMMLEAIKAELEANPRLKMDYPKICGTGRVWQVGVIVTRNNIKVQIAGSGKKVRGWRHGPHRPDYVILDDIENDENVVKKEQRDKLQKWLKKAVLKLGPPDGSMDLIYLGTVLHYDSVLNRTLKSPTWNSRRFQSIIRWPDNMDMWERWEEILINDGEDASTRYYSQNKALMDKGAVVSWPSTRPLLMLMTIRADGHHEFDCEHQNDPGKGEDAPFKTITFWVQPNRDWVFFGACDPSLGKNNKGRDPSAIGVAGFDRNTGVMDVVEAKIARRVPSKIITDIIDLQREYNCIIWSFESVQFQEFMRTELVKQSAITGCPVPAMPVIPAIDKTLRIESLQPHIFNGLIRLHRRQTVLIEQLSYWPEADHDDGPDMLHMLWTLCVSRAGGIPKIRAGKQQRDNDEPRHW